MAQRWYPAVNTIPNSARITNVGSVKYEPTRMRNSAMNPLIPGNPSEARNPASMTNVSFGIYFAMPPKSLIILVPAECWITPQDMNRIPVMRPCENCWYIAPLTESGISAAAPRAVSYTHLRAHETRHDL